MTAGDLFVRADADISDCGRYRYRLTREWDLDFGLAAFVLCNPSTADALKDDHTVRKCMGFARRWGCGGIVIVNVCAYRSRHPKDLLVVADPVGPRNLDAVSNVAGEWCFRKANGHSGVAVVVAGWGNALPREFEEHAEQALGWIDHVPVHCLGRTSSGRPRHPLTLSYATPLEVFTDVVGEWERERRSE